VRDAPRTIALLVAGERETLHDLGPARDGRSGQSARDDLPERREVGDDAGLALHAARRDAEAGYDLVEQKYRPGLAGELACGLEEARRQRDRSARGARGFEDHTRELARREGSGERIDLGRDDARFAQPPARVAAARGDVERRLYPREREVAPSVEVALELEDAAAGGERAREA